MTHTVQNFKPIYCLARDHPVKPTWPARSTSLIQTNSPCFKSHQLSIAPQLHVEAYESCFSHPGILSGLTSWRSCAEKQSCHELMSVMIRSCPDDTSMLQSSPPLPLVSIPPSLFQWLLSLGERNWLCPICSWTVHKQVFSTLRPAASYYISHQLRCRETSLIMLNSCTNLRM